MSLLSNGYHSHSWIQPVSRPDGGIAPRKHHNTAPYGQWRPWRLDKPSTQILSKDPKEQRAKIPIASYIENTGPARTAMQTSKISVKAVINEPVLYCWLRCYSITLMFSPNSTLVHSGLQAEGAVYKVTKRLTCDAAWNHKSFRPEDNWSIEPGFSKGFYF